jgi:hypothetical protein
MTKFEELKQECKVGENINPCQDKPIYWFTEDKLTALLETYDQDKWLKYPENRVPFVQTSYEITRKSLNEVTIAIYDMNELWRDSIGRVINDVIAFQELPKSYQP